HRVGADLDLAVRVGPHVMVPVRVVRCAALRCEYDVVVTIAAVGQRVDALGAGAGAAVVEKQDRHALERLADLAGVGSELLDDLPVPIVPFAHTHIQRPVPAPYSNG